MATLLLRAVDLQQQQQDKADQEASAATALKIKHAANLKAMAAKYYAAKQTAMRQTSAKQKAELLTQVKDKLQVLQSEDTEMKEQLFEDIEASLEDAQQTNRRLELELAQQTKAARSAHTLARARLHSVDSFSDSSDSDDGNWAPGRQPAISSQQPAIQVTSWLSNKRNQKYQPQRITDLCRFVVLNALPVSGVQGLLYDMASLLTGVTVSKVSLTCRFFYQYSLICFLVSGASRLLGPS